MPDTLRARIAPVLQQHYGLNDNVSVRNRGVVMSVGNFAEWVLDAILPLVEQEREKWERATDAVVEKMAEKDAAIAAIEAGLRAEFANGGTYEGHDIISAFGEFIEHHAKLESALAEKDAQIAALQAKIDDAEGPWWATELASENYGLNVQIAALKSVARGLRDAIACVWNDAEDCEECEALEEVKGPMGGDGGPCAVHRSVTLYYALLAADEVLGPCRCGHKRSEHHDEDTTRCRLCDCQAFALPRGATRSVPDA